MSVEQTKGKIKVEGIVKGIKNENAYREGFTKAEKPYKSLAFFLETSPINKVRVEIFGMERTEVSAYSQKAKESKKIPWAQRDGNHGDFKVLGTNMFLEKGTDGKNTRKVLVEYDAVDYILEHLNDGDSVRVNGEIGFQEFENQQGEMKESQSFNIRSISKIDPIDFEAEEFKEVSNFEQEIVVADTLVDDETKQLYINAYTIAYNKDITSATFVVDGEKLPKLANNMAKRLGYGDHIKVFGKIVNSSIREEAETEETMDDAEDWGGDDEIKSSMESTVITRYVNELQVTTVDSATYEPKKYKEEDLISSDEDAFNGKVDDDFSDASDDEEIDDLPF